MAKKLLTTLRSPAPFEDDAEYLQAELDWLKVRVARIVAERRVREAAD